MKESKDDTQHTERYTMFLRINIVKTLYYPKQSIDSMQSLSNYQWHFHRTRTKKSQNLYGETKEPE